MTWALCLVQDGNRVSAQSFRTPIIMHIRSRNQRVFRRDLGEESNTYNGGTPHFVSMFVCLNWIGLGLEVGRSIRSLTRSFIGRDPESWRSQRGGVVFLMSTPPYTGFSFWEWEGEGVLCLLTTLATGDGKKPSLG